MKIAEAFASVTYLRAIAHSLDSLANSQRILADIAQRRWEEDHPLPTRATTGQKPFEVGTLDIREAEARYRKERDATAAGVDLE
jgi:hypothetical protein